VLSGKPVGDYVTFSGNEPVREVDDVLGWRISPGVYRGQAQQMRDGEEVKSVTWTADYGPDGHRRMPTVDAPRAVAWFFGCSFTEAYMVDNEMSWVGRWAAAHPDVQTRNLAHSAYGTVQAYLLLRQELQTQPPPDAIVLGYCEFWTARDSAIPSWRFHRPAHLRIARARLIDGELAVDTIPTRPANPPDPPYTVQKAVTIALLDAIAGLCREHRVTPVLAILNTDHPADSAIKHARSTGWVIRDLRQSLDADSTFG
jgi:hypothetical protein